jgi:hypothetical protein
MADIGSLLDSCVAAGLKAADQQLASYLANIVKTTVALDDKTSKVAQAAALKDKGVTPDFWAGARVTIAAQLTMTSLEKRVITASGGGTLGPINLQGSLSEETDQGTNTNLSVTIQFERQDANQFADYSIRAYDALTAVPLPVGTAPLPPK